MICHPCFLYAKLNDVPQKLKMHDKGNFGVIKKESKCERNKELHCKVALHTWCVEKLRKQLKAVQEAEKVCIVHFFICNLLIIRKGLVKIWR